MSKRTPIDELREIVKQFKRDAENLYRYGDPGRSVDIFNKLSTNDKTRLLYWAMTQEYDEDIKAVAKHLMQTLREKFSNLEQLSTQLYPEDKAEIDDVGSQSREKLLALSYENKTQIALALSKACIELGSLNVEDAYWVLIPQDPTAETIWISARGRQGEISSFISWADKVDYAPSNDELYNLYSAMRSASAVLHIHNHPNSLIPIASSADRAFAKSWKNRRSELVRKLKFFVVTESAVVEYTENEEIKDFRRPNFSF
jgi:hypothetical protein